MPTKENAEAFLLKIAEELNKKTGFAKYMNEL